MVVLAWRHGSCLVQGRAQVDLCLRVVGSARDGQIVRLSGPKCSIGSAEGCTLRLRARGVRPLHCILLRGARGTAARAWAAGTRLNGQSFRDSLLVPGDRLSIGPVEFEVLDASSAEHMVAHRSALTEPIERFSNALYPGGFEGTASRRAEVARSRVRNLIAALRGMRREAAEMRSQIDRAVASETSRQANEPELAQRQQEEAARLAREDLSKALGDFERQRTAWAADNAQSHAQLADERAALEGQRDEAARLRQEFERQHSDLEAQFQARITELDREQRDWQVHRAAEETHLVEERARFEAERTEAIEQRASYEEQLVAAQRDRRQAAAELEAASQEVERRRAEAEARIAAETAALNERQAQFERRLAEFDDARGKDTERSTDAARAEAEVRAAVNALEARRGAFEAQQAAAREELARGRAECEQTERAQRKTQENLDAEFARLQAAEAALSTGESELAQARTAFEARTAELFERERQVQSQRDALAADREALSAEHEAWRERRAAEELEACDQIERLDAQRTEFERQREQFEEQQAESAGRHSALEEERRALSREREAFRAQLAGFNRGRQEWERAQEELSAEAQAALFAERATLALIRQAWEADQFAAERNLAQQTREINRREEQLAARVTEAEGDVDRDTQVVLNRTMQAHELELETRRNEFEQDRESWDQSRARCDERYTRQLEQFEQQLTALREREEALEQERQSLVCGRQEQEHSAQALRDLAAELESRERQLAAREAHGGDSLQQASESHRAVDAERVELDAVRQELEREREALDGDRLQTAARLEREHDELEQLRAQLEASRAEDDDQDAVGGEEFEPEVQTAAQRGAAAQRLSDEQSIEEYMAALLNRTRGGLPTDAVIATQPRRNKRKSDPPSSSERPKLQKPSEVAPPAVVDMPSGGVELARRSAPTERSDLAAMRELANTQAFMAIATHGNQRMFKKAARNWGLGAACAAVTIMLLSLTPASASVLRTAATAGLVVSVYFSFLGLTATQQLIVMRQRQKKGPRSTPAETASKKSS